jgi:hypothetical protein
MKRPPRHKGRRKPPGGAPRTGFSRRTPPPERTGLESVFLESRKRSGLPLVFCLRSGTTISGVVEDFDRDLIRIQPSEGPGLILRKIDIRYLHEADRE